MDNDDILEIFGKKLQEVRLKHGLSQEKLAEIARLDRTYISSMERGRRNVSLLNIIKVANALKICPSAFLVSKCENSTNNINEGYKFYKKHIYDEQKIELLREYNLKVAGHVHSVIWELFCALLTGEKAEGITGADLHGWEVKSAKGKGSYEYQYHRHAHLEKLDEDCIVNHIYCSYSEEYDGVVVRVLKGTELKEKYFDVWKPECIEKYGNPDNLRFRKSVNYKYVQDNGLLVLKVEKGKLTYKNDQFIEQLKIR